MEVDFAFLCQYASPSSEGYIDAMGIGVDGAVASGLPHSLDPLYLVFQARPRDSDDLACEIALRFIDEDGDDIEAQMRREFTVDDGSTIARFYIHIRNLKVENEGTYYIVLELDGDEIERLPYTVSI